MKYKIIKQSNISASDKSYGYAHNEHNRGVMYHCKYIIPLLNNALSWVCRYIPIFVYVHLAHEFQRRINPRNSILARQNLLHVLVLLHYHFLDSFYVALLLSVSSLFISFLSLLLMNKVCVFVAT